MTRPRRPWLKPHLHMVRGLWCVCYRDPNGVVVPARGLPYKTVHSRKATEAQVWAANRNARVVAAGGPWNCRCLP